MDWDIQIIKHYSSTSHSRLLNQLKRELRENPLPRPVQTARGTTAPPETTGRPPAKGGSNRRFRYVPLGQTDNRSTGSARGAGSHPSTPPTGAQSAYRYESPTPATTSSFRDRLQAVEVR